MRGQAHALEALVAALLLISGLVFATQVTAVTPLSASTSNQHIENQQRATVQGLLAASAENGDIQEAVLYWNPENETFAGASDGGAYAEGGPPNAFGKALNETLIDRRIAFNVEVRYRTPSGGSTAIRMVNMGSPSDNAVSATRIIAVYNDSNLTAPEYTDRTLEDLQTTSGESFYADNIDGNQLYNVLEVRVIAWRK
jgi:hypothetical protein